MYYGEYQAWQIGEYKYLYEKDRTEFKIRFGQFISEQRKDDRLSYLHRLLRTANRQRSLLPCLIFDNTDQFPQAFQERVFQYAYALYRAVIAFLVVPITDRTIWQLSKAGPFQSYPTKAFFLPVPSTKEILEKRVAYLRKRTHEERKGGSYFLSRGIRLTLENIVGFAATIEEIFIKREFIARRVAWLANNDLRRGLELTRRIVTSPVLQAEQLVAAYVSGFALELTDSRITRALITDRHRYFDQDTNAFIQNLFEVPSDRVTTPLLRVSILRVLLDALGPARDDLREQYVELARLIEHFEPTGIRGHDVLGSLELLMRARLIEPYNPADDSIDPGKLVRITNAGRMHLEMVFNDDQYMNQMAMRTAIRSKAVSDRMRPTALSFPKEAQAWRELSSAFVDYLLSEDAAIVTIPRDGAYDSQRILRLDLRSRWITAPSALDFGPH